MISMPMPTSVPEMALCVLSIQSITFRLLQAWRFLFSLACVVLWSVPLRVPLLMDLSLLSEPSPIKVGWYDVTQLLFAQQFVIGLFFSCLIYQNSQNGEVMRDYCGCRCHRKYTTRVSHPPYPIPPRQRKTHGCLNLLKMTIRVYDFHKRYMSCRLEERRKSASCLNSLP